MIDLMIIFFALECLLGAYFLRSGMQRQWGKAGADMAYGMIMLIGSIQTIIYLVG